ncbi:MAG: hypothetical protein ACQ5SW_05325 [Sphaerochaetaceae bacterium]
MRKLSFAQGLMMGGTTLLLLLLVSPFLLALFSLVTNHVFLFDYLLTAELGVVACLGALVLTIGTIQRKIQATLLCIFLSLMLGSLCLLMLLGDPSPMVWIPTLTVYNLSLIGLVFHGMRYLRH